MAGLIPRQFIDDLLARTDIVELIDAKVPLKKAGKNYQACCPFHTEKSPSFTVSRDKQFYHCFGCGAHGNAISFVMEYERLDFVDAIEELADLQNLEVPREQNQTPQQRREQQQRAQQKQDDYQLLGEISKFYLHQLKVHPEKERIIEYLKGRGLTGEIVKRFGIGFSPDSWDAVMNAYGKNFHASKQLVDLGMAIQGDKNRPYDRFRGRIMFPIRDKRGRVIGFGGRVMDNSTPKYLNSPETRVYHKGQELYGLYEAKQHAKNLTRLVVVEGYMDVVALAQHGVDYAVASLGTSTTPEQLQVLFRNVKEVICCYDGDRAGREAAWRAMENALPLIQDGYSLKFIFLPDGEDPDSLVRTQGKTAFEQQLDQAKPLSRFLFDHLNQGLDLSTAEGKAQLTSQFEPLLKKMPESTIKDGIVTELASSFGLGTEQQLTKISQKTKSTTQQAAAKTTTKATPVRTAIALLLEQPQLIQSLPNINPQGLAHIQVPGIPLLIEIIQQCQQSPNLTSGQLLELWRDREEGKQLAKLLCWEHLISEDAREQVLTDQLAKLFSVQVEQRMEMLLQKARLGQLTAPEKAELQTLLSQAN